MSLYHEEISVLVQSQGMYVQATQNLGCSDVELSRNSLLVLNNLVNDSSFLEQSFSNDVLPSLFSLLQFSRDESVNYICQIFKSLLRNPDFAAQHSPRVIQMLETLQLKQLHRSENHDTTLVKMNILVLALQIPEARDWLVRDQMLFHALHSLSKLSGADVQRNALICLASLLRHYSQPVLMQLLTTHKYLDFL